MQKWLIIKSNHSLVCSVYTSLYILQIIHCYLSMSSTSLSQKPVIRSSTNVLADGRTVFHVLIHIPVHISYELVNKFSKDCSMTSVLENFRCRKVAQMSLMKFLAFTIYRIFPPYINLM